MRKVRDVGRISRFWLRFGLLLLAQALLLESSLAAQIRLTDETGAPLANAVLLIDGGAARTERQLCDGSG